MLNGVSINRMHNVYVNPTNPGLAMMARGNARQVVKRLLFFIFLFFVNLSNDYYYCYYYRYIGVRSLRVPFRNGKKLYCYYSSDDG